MIKVNSEKLRIVREKEARQRRDLLLASSDWAVLRAQELNEPLTAEWIFYRRALRDISHQPGFPFAIEWPALPAK